MNSIDFEIVQKSPLFANLPEEELKNIIGNEPPHNHAKGKVLFQQGDEADRFFVILDGLVKIYRQLPSGDEAILHVCSKGETFAEMALFIGRRYPATAEVVSDARLLSINCNHFEARLRENPRIAMNMLASAAARAKNLVTEIEQIKGRNSIQRLAFFLLELCRENESSAAVNLPYEKTLIAAQLGMQPESLSRIFSKMRGYGINCVKDKIIIADVNILRRLATGEDQ